MQAMVSQMLDKGKVLMRVEGPYGQPYGPGWHAHDVLTIFAGGIGERLGHCFCSSKLPLRRRVSVLPIICCAHSIQQRSRAAFEAS